MGGGGGGVNFIDNADVFKWAVITLYFMAPNWSKLK